MESSETTNHEIFMSEFEPYLEKLKSKCINTLLLGHLIVRFCHQQGMSILHWHTVMFYQMLPQITLPTKLIGTAVNCMIAFICGYVTQKSK